jgi:hypothetical protein
MSASVSCGKSEIIVSKLIPLASQPNTSPTEMRVPRTQGFPKRRSGSIEMRGWSWVIKIDYHKHLCEGILTALSSAKKQTDPVKAARQTVTQPWWHSNQASVSVCISPYVVEEVSLGDPKAASQRLESIRSINLLDTNVEIEALADFLLLGGGLPSKARFDALHIACDAFHGVNIMLTWNFKHIANPVKLLIMRRLCAAREYRLSELVSPS